MALQNVYKKYICGDVKFVEKDSNTMQGKHIAPVTCKTISIKRLCVSQT